MAGNTSDYPSVWSIISGSIGNILEIALNQTVTDFVSDSLNLQTFKSSVLNLLRHPFSEIPAGHLMGQGNQTVNADINATVYNAVFNTMSSFNLSGWGDISFRDKLAKRLTLEIEMKVFNEILNNSTNAENNSFGDFFHNLPLKDETLFVALVCMAVIVPIIFITLFFIFFYKRRQENKEKSQEMLLREQPETAVEDYKGDIQMGDEPPDLDLKMAPV